MINPIDDRVAPACMWKPPRSRLFPRRTLEVLAFPLAMPDDQPDPLCVTIRILLANRQAAKAANGEVRLVIGRAPNQ